ncbi:MAG: 1-(5-phosphoribosyl)-5-[(5-phosphoribosylamino)methylideneamino]imidazole-4-carboxamide isomerase [Candidatus Omnitrophica bacterium CG11_big_fil_rev_8_21_14_0_20_45_26]|uniref:1-(5-phosphoribosyl)-5-[(5-phosphoribosylamino)methylideneamino] imidazole-4-carboxamide isomerase n=1 Tax=Candidatus Abzuiibacterium crystallinum TaxID=1974748 RepID=A0A2H0LUV1_9BACT|nr:MAG: 1-(5-phosphoribosyl)-5-[(5-phosphoribosylamino)methylideneamino]imidazole-4-carboxamide isomerase [Candidatus Omnitrophica bacterium CG11_big_fil_rev_8_21_14_0_20_45_26]PIW65024.1 MAG: 1-(5-phosphoribosyl)-5-[(5-phosphoribosylamino)methylideneamino]imidazole-4-carboxamide isomerase [Candidatus Omnitrophica bacterium CG12_big_fil_rev_8_21_14_0_65_45_16]
MIIIPAIDLKDGKVVRLTRGDFAQEKVYSQAPEQVAMKWQQDGAEMIHVVDLDGALAGKRKNLGSLKNICQAVKAPIQFGGGLRSVQAVADVFQTGVSRAVIGTKALDLKMLTQLINRFGDKIVVGIDIKNGIIQIQGWLKQVKLIKLESFCKEIERIGVKHIVLTDVSRDGTLMGPNVTELKNICTKTSMNVIASGGISTLKDFKFLKALECSNLWGVIVGKALYEQRFTLQEAIQAIQSDSTHE